MSRVTALSSVATQSQPNVTLPKNSVMGIPIVLEDKMNRDAVSRIASHFYN